MSLKIQKIRDGTPLEAISRNSKNSWWYPFGGGRNFDISKKDLELINLALSSKLDVPSNIVQKKRVARILVFKIRSSQEILKIRDSTPLEAEGILIYRKRTSKLFGWALF
ncbi:hypothetical protein OROGR_015513 [Orobanche gracilis]